MELYDSHKVNPLTPLLALIIQIPIVFVLYRIFVNGFSGDALDLLYPSITLPESPNQSFLGLIDLTRSNLWVVGFAAIAQYVQGRLSLAKKSKKKGDEPSKAERVGQNMVTFMPILTVMILFNLPSAIGLYWGTTTVFSIFQQLVVNHSLNKAEGKGISLGSHGESQGENKGDI